jgi:hypothetical protein
VKTLVEEALGLFDHRSGDSLIAAPDVQDPKAAGEIDELVPVHIGDRGSVAVGHENGGRIEDGAWDCIVSTFEKLS